MRKGSSIQQTNPKKAKGKDDKKSHPPPRITRNYPALTEVGHALVIKPGFFTTKQQLLDLMEYIYLPHYGNDSGEAKDIKETRDWPSVHPTCAKFYGKSNKFYFLGYGCHDHPVTTPLNHVAKKMKTSHVRPWNYRGEIVVVTNGPKEGARSFNFSKEDVADAVMRNIQHGNPDAIFRQKKMERLERVFEGMGMGSGIF